MGVDDASAGTTSEAVRMCRRTTKNVVKRDWDLGGLGYATILFQSR